MLNKKNKNKEIENDKKNKKTRGKYAKSKNVSQIGPLDNSEDDSLKHIDVADEYIETYKINGIFGTSIVITMLIPILSFLFVFLFNGLFRNILQILSEKTSTFSVISSTSQQATMLIAVVSFTFLLVIFGFILHKISFNVEDTYKGFACEVMKGIVNKTFIFSGIIFIAFVAFSILSVVKYNAFFGLNLETTLSALPYIYRRTLISTIYVFVLDIYTFIILNSKFIQMKRAKKKREKYAEDKAAIQEKYKLELIKSIFGKEGIAGKDIEKESVSDIRNKSVIDKLKESAAPVEEIFNQEMFGVKYDKKDFIDYKEKMKFYDNLYEDFEQYSDGMSKELLKKQVSKKTKKQPKIINI